MEHVVFFPAPDGSPAFRRVATLEDAVALVEHLRNVEGVGSVSVHALTEVPLHFRAYYKVEVPSAAPEVPAQSRVEEPAEQPVPQDAVSAVAQAAPVEAPQPELEPVQAGGRRDGGKSLGFFA